MYMKSDYSQMMIYSPTHVQLHPWNTSHHTHSLMVCTATMDHT